ncbi:MAG TPA: rhodanese-like domain-containing protein [Polyangiales bacterium]|jgi:rhodanese-related sulfurtransferase|nr:rhodanese-like domain-containing protein [Polyangiales bacterium]
MTVKRVSPQEADALVKNEDYVYVDVRSIPEFDAGHPTGAYNVPLMHATPSGMRPNADFMSVIAAVFPKHSKLVLGCRSGNRSLRAAEALIAAGFETVVDQRAGTDGARDAFGQLQEAGWHAAGLDMADEAHPERSYEALLARKGS